MAERFEKVLEDLDSNIERKAKVGLVEVADEILRLSNKEVPFDKGTLARSGEVKPKENEVEVGYYGVAYAHRLHEHPEYKFKGGRKGKYLEDPIKSNLSRFEKILGIKLSYEMGK